MAATRDAHEDRDPSGGYLRAAFETTGAVIVALSRDLAILDLNEAAASAYAVRREDVIGKNYVESFVPKKYRDSVRADIRKVLEGMPTRNFPNPITRADGEVRHIVWNVERFFDASEQPAGVVAVGIDVTRSHEVEKRLKESADLFHKFSAAANEAIIIHDKGRILEANQTMTRMFGYPQSELRGMYVAQFVAPESLEATLRHISEGNETPFDLISVRRNGSYFPTKANARNIVYKGKPARVVVLRDITEEKKTERQLQSALAEAERSNRAKSTFLANVSHEIRTPLTAILGFSEILEGESVTREQSLEYLDRIRRNGRHLLELVEDILDLSKVESGKLALEPKKLLVSDFLQDCLVMLHGRSSRADIALVLQYDGLVPRTIVTDERRLKQIMLNVIGNALKFTEEGSVTVTLSTQSWLDLPKPLLAIEVKDTGCGMNVEEAEHIFEPFVQTRAGSDAAAGGTGLGLSLAKRLAQALGGDIHLAFTEPGVGSTFRITIDPGPLDDVPMDTSPQITVMGFDGLAWHASEPATSPTP